MNLKCRKIQPFKPWILLSGVGFVTVLVSFGLAPGKGTHTYYARNVVTPCIEVPPNGEHWARSGCSGESRIGDWRAEMRFNRMGIRDKDYSSEPAKGVFRVLVLGSSNTLGPGIQESDTFPRQLEKSLRALGKNVEVINGAMLGYCTMQTSFRVRKLIAAYRPQLVLYQFVQGACPLFDGSWHGRVVTVDGWPERIDRTPFPSGAGLDWLNGFFFKYPSLFFAWLTMEDQRLKIRFSGSVVRWKSKEERLASYLEPTLIYLRLLKNAAEQAGAGFELVTYQMRPFTQSVPVQFQSWIVNVLSRFIRPVDLAEKDVLGGLRHRGFSVISGDFSTPELLLPGDVHLTPAGLRRFAEAAARELASRISRGKALRKIQ